MRGIETVWEHPKGETDWEGDARGESPSPREINGCILIPRTHPDDETLIIDGWQLFVPPDQRPPHPESRIKAPDPADMADLVMWDIDGGVAPYRKSAYKGALMTLERVR